MKKWILAVYAGEDYEKSILYRTAFEMNGYGWETEVTDQTLILAAAVLFICRPGLFDDPARKEIYETCTRRNIPVILAEKRLLREGELPDEGETALDASMLSFDDLKEYLKEETAEEPQPKESKFFNYLSLVMIILVLLGMFWFVVRISPSADVSSAEPVSQIQPEQNFGDAVVQVWSIGSFGNKVYRGSGFAVSTAGDIVTNAHVVDHPSSRYSVVYLDHVYNAEVSAVSRETDLALLKIDHGTDKFLRFSTQATEKNTPVYVIGYPESQGKTVTAGLYDGRTFPGTQTDYEIIITGLKQGNSGSPVCTNDGGVIGVASAVSADNEEIGLMIPAKECISFLKNYVFLEER